MIYLYTYNFNDIQLKIELGGLFNTLTLSAIVNTHKGFTKIGKNT